MVVSVENRITKRKNTPESIRLPILAYTVPAAVELLLSGLFKFADKTVEKKEKEVRKKESSATWASS